MGRVKDWALGTSALAPVMIHREVTDQGHVRLSVPVRHVEMEEASDCPPGADAGVKVEPTNASLQTVSERAASWFRAREKRALKLQRRLKGQPKEEITP